MSEPHRTPNDQRTPSVVLSELALDAKTALSLDGVEWERRFAELPGDAVLVTWEISDSDRPGTDGALRGLYRVLGAAARAQRVAFPARWLPVRRPSADASDEFSRDARLLAIARSDAALQRLFAEASPELEGRGLVRADEPVVLLGVEGDALSSTTPTDAGSRSTELRRRAEQWIHRLGADRVALVVSEAAEADHPLAEVARRRSLPLIALGSATGVPWHRSHDAAVATPLLWTDFQFDDEHRLPDDTQVPGLRDLLHRGALLRERTLFERLPEAWRLRVDAELRALYAWHVSPLLRRVAALVQTCDAVADVDVRAPLPQLRSVTAYLLGLTDQRPVDAVLALEDPVESARRLAMGLQESSREISVRVDPLTWPQLHARLAAWSEGGLLAACDEPVEGAERAGAARTVRSYCFSGRSLALRAPLRRGRDGILRIDLDREDRRVLGWFELRCEVDRASSRQQGATSTAPDAQQSAAAVSAAPSRQSRRGPAISVPEMLGLSVSEPNQLEFGFDEASSHRKKTA